MQRWVTLVVVVLFAVGCLEPVRETSLGQLPGADGGTTDGGGLADAGGGGAGGATGTDGGPPVLPDAGFVARLPNLAEARCNTRLPLPGTCANDGGECITLHRADGGVEEVASAAQVFNGGTTYHYGLGAVGGGVAFATYVSGGAQSTIWHARPGAAPVALQTSSDTLNVWAVADASPTYGFWYIAERYSSSPVALVGRDLMLAAGVPPSGTSGAAAQVPSPTSNAVAKGSDYYVASADGLRSYYPAGEGLLVPTGAADETIVTVAVDESDVFYLQCKNPATFRCDLYRVAHPGGSPRVKLASLDGLGGAVSLGVLGSHLYVLGVDFLARVPKAGGATELVYRGEDFPQYGGTLQSGSLVVRGDKLYFGSICHFDADAPGYGTIELDPAAKTARWLDDDPAYPFVPHVTPSGPATYDTWWVTPDGIYTWRRR